MRIAGLGQGLTIPRDDRAVALCVAIVLALSFAGPAAATCTIVGSGTQSNLQSGDQITCTGVNNSSIQTGNGQANVTVNIGDGTTPSTLDAPSPFSGVNFNTTSNSAITVFNQASVTAEGTGINIVGGSNNVVNIEAGGLVATTTLGSFGIALQGSNDNTINISGTVGDLSPGSLGVGILSSSAGNTLNVLAGGIVQSNGQYAIDLSGAGAGNIIANQGTISSTTNLAIFGSANQDIVVNMASITTGGSTAIDLGGGADVLQLRDGSSVTGLVYGGTGTDTLSFATNGTGAFDLSTFGATQQFREFEALTKQGAGSWTLTGTTTETATMDIEAGTLSVNGAMADIDTTVSGGTLGGSGTVGTLTVTSGGTVAPGNSIGTLTVDGMATFATGSTYSVEANAAGQSDLLHATGVAFVDGGTVAVTTPPGAFAATTQYTILTSDVSVVGTFDAVTVAGYNPQFFSAALTYDAFAVFLTLDYNSAAFLEIAETPNQKAVAGVMSALGTAAPFVAQFVGLTDDQVRLGLETLLGEVHASVKGVIGTQPSLFASAVRYRLTTAFDADGHDKLARVVQQGPTYRLGAPGEGQSLPDIEILPPTPSPYLWLSGAGAAGDIEGDGNAASVRSNARGVFGGLDMPLDTRVRIGFAAGWSRTSSDVDQRASSADANAWHVAGTGAAAFGNTRVRGLLAYDSYGIETARTAIIGTDRYLASANYDGSRVEGLLEGGYVFNGWIDGSLETYVGAGFSHLALGSFSETGGGEANLTGASSSDNAPFSVLGVRYTAAWLVGGIALNPSLDVAWRHFFDGTDPTRVLAFAVASSSPWTVAGAPVGTDAAVISAALEAGLTQSLSADVRYQGELSGGAEVHAIEGGLKLRF